VDRHYGGKDQLLLAVIADLIAMHCRGLEERGRTLPGPVERLRFYVLSTAQGLVDTRGTSGPRFITSQHWRLHQEYPEEVAAATKPYTDLLRAVLAEGREAGVLAPRDDERDAWLITKVVMSVFHHYAFAPDDPGLHTAGEDLWRFCLAAVNGAPPAAAAPPRRTMRRFRRG
jgi:TetR/AcrR family transcriptional regulator